jgi:bla regulator protein BlaR1
VSALLQIGLINAAVASVLAVAVALIGRRVRQPALMHALWIIVLVKLVTPPVFEIPVVRTCFRFTEKPAALR